jgi:uncharacterized membrane protein
MPNLWKTLAPCGTIPQTDMEIRKMPNFPRHNFPRHVAIGLALASAPAYAAGTHFGFKQIIVAGSSNVQAFALNNKSAIAGLYTDNTGGHGFILSGSALTVLPAALPDCNGGTVPIPKSINAAGDVVGLTYCGTTYGFLWHNGAYLQAGYVSLGIGGAPVIGINNKGEEFYDFYDGDGGFVPYAGMPGAFQQLTPPGAFPYVSGLNNNGVLAGTSSPQVNSAVFTDDHGIYTGLVPPGAMDSFSGAINDHGEVAGLYQSSKTGAIGGFVYQAGAYTRFSIPRVDLYVGLYQVAAVHAINKAGRVVGIYTDSARNIQRAFLFNGTTVSLFGNFPPADIVTIALNDEGTMLVSDYNGTQAKSTSWRVLCGGPGC